MMLNIFLSLAEGSISESELAGWIRLPIMVTSKNALCGIFRDGNGKVPEKVGHSVSFIFNHLRA